MLTDFAVRKSPGLHIIRDTPGDDCRDRRDEGLQKIYDGKQARGCRRGIDLSVQEGELFGLLGPNGCGQVEFSKMCTRGQACCTAGTTPIEGAPNAGFRQRLPRNMHRPAVGKARVVHDADGCRLARTVRSQQPKSFALLNAEDRCRRRQTTRCLPS